jgi:alkylhydroperoxidase family enzyme
VQQGVTEEMYEHLDEYRSSELYTDQEKVAIEYTEMFALDHQSITQDLFDRLGQHFDEGEIVELTVVIARHLAFGRLTAVLELGFTCPIEL